MTDTTNRDRPPNVKPDGIAAFLATNSQVSLFTTRKAAPIALLVSVCVSIVFGGVTFGAGIILAQGLGIVEQVFPLLMTGMVAVVVVGLFVERRIYRAYEDRARLRTALYLRERDSAFFSQLDSDPDDLLSNEGQAHMAGR